LIIWRSPEHHHAKGCSLGSNQKTNEISEAAISLALFSSEYQLIFDRIFTKFGVISLLIPNSALLVPNGAVESYQFILADFSE
jgi:hypothetical protein